MLYQRRTHAGMALSGKSEPIFLPNPAWSPPHPAFGDDKCDRISWRVRQRQLLTMAHPVRRDDVKTFVW